MNLLAVATILAFLFVSMAFWRRWGRSLRADYIRTYSFPPALYDKLRSRHPDLNLKDCQLVGRELQQLRQLPFRIHAVSSHRRSLARADPLHAPLLRFLQKSLWRLSSSYAGRSIRF